MICRHCGTDNMEGAAFCGNCGEQLLSERDETSKIEDICMACGNPLEKGAKFCGYCGARIADDDDDTISEDSWIISPADSAVVKLIREKNKETIIIDHFPFVIGRARECDYIILNNLAIGRRHLLVEQCDGDVLFRDLGSANHTFLDSSKVEGAVRVSDGLRIQMADEYYTFSVE